MKPKLNFYRGHLKGSRGTGPIDKGMIPRNVDEETQSETQSHNEWLRYQILKLKLVILIVRGHRDM